MRSLPGRAEESRAALKLVSTAPAHHELAVRELLGVQRSAIDDLLAQRVLVRTGEYLAMRQAVLCCAIYIALAAVNRQELHSQLHTVHRKYGSSLAQWHSSFLHDGEASPRMLLETGLHLVRQGSGGLATAFADRAILLLSFEAEELADLLCALGSAMVDMGELAYAERYLRKANELVRGDAAVIVATLHQQIRSEFMRSHELDSQYIPSAMRQFGAQEPGLCVQLLSMVAVFHGERWEVDEAQQMLNLALPLLPQVNPAVAFEFEIASAWVGALTGDYRAGDRVSEASAEQALISPLFAILLARSWTYAERYEQARMLFESLLSRSPTLDPLWLETARFSQAENEIRSGHLRRAVKSIETLHASSDVQQFHVNYLTSMRAWYWLAQNELARAQPFIDAVFKDASGSRNSINASRISALLGRSALSRADFSTAFAAFVTCA
ncbi:tetratricopeptide repeat domain protein [Renibacterium salmoninarum ATCC 33209]|uniref:Tetratricopeptide repeat domain protein n=1 Tax=Renibacterium salmoninarum (strain ATCC 33209 / DSM 20767 / JCM 11484 / NBRC 15589 / NCIMB 2235) TaxID=288705 RepID=A9WTC3_RENSM|nr:hypothetical protein [Renibacterium salmoninarum]ABY24444.1 tetratricopeptide repeat domain protein [Renibacterium salmoninarum ATCC 33209]